MVLPLYMAHNAPQGYDKSFNTGLWYDKFFQEWSSTWSITDEGKKKWIEKMVANPVGDEALLKEAVLRQIKLITELTGEYRCFATSWRFVTGLGRYHPVENGFAWHHTLGVPYLPGSSVKGIVRSWTESWACVPPREIERIFGPEDGKAQRHVGTVIFFDALPIRSVQLEPDVMTPHYHKYYQQEEPRLAPGDWYDPKPIPFLTVAPKQTFFFGLAPGCSTKAQDRGDVLKALEWLTEALTTIGAGAKTAAGYGRFERRESEEAEISKWLETVLKAQQATAQKREETMSPMRQEMMRDGYDEDQEAFMRAMGEKWLKKLTDEQVSLEDKREIALLLKQWYLTYREEQWRRPNKKNKEKTSLIKKVLGE